MTQTSPGSAPPPPFCQRRTRSPTSSTTSSSSSSSSSSSIIFTPSPSHDGYLSASSNIPFSWEQTPGIPKTLNSPSAPPPSDLHRRRLPLPPPLRSESFRVASSSSSSSSADVDPFAVALAECAKDPPAPESDLWMGSKESMRSRRRSSFWIGDRFGLGLLDLNGSCKNSCAVAESTIEVPRRGAAAYRILNRRIG